VNPIPEGIGEVGGDAFDMVVNVDSEKVGNE